MTSNNKIRSLHRYLLIAIVGFSLLTVVLSHGILSMLVIEEEKNQLIEDTKRWGRMASLMSIEDLYNDGYDALGEKLARTVSLSGINYVHIYRVTPETGKISFFTSYNRSSNHPPIPDKIASIEKLATPNVTPNFIELIMPIDDQENIVGYIYLQTGLETLNSQTKKYVIAISLIAIFVIIFAIALSLNLKNKLISALAPIIGTIQQISQKKDFSVRCPSSEYRELDNLAQNLNTLLNRVQKHITREQEATNKISQKNAALTDKVNSRTDALKESNQELLSTLEKLHQFQDQLVESEKMASLGDMVAGVAHEVNTPIGLGVTASTLLEDRLLSIKKAFNDKTLKSSQLRRFLDDGEENVAIIYRNLERAASLISSFKKVAVDQSNEDERTIVVNELVKGVLLTLAPKLNALPYRIMIDCPQDLSVVTKAGPISQILINLIMNSVIHGFDGAEEGDININIIQMSSQLNITYRDNGKGIKESIKNKIFDPFTTTKRGEGGSGLGLHLVYNLVTQALGGSIQLENHSAAKGVHFEISFPVK